MRHSERVLSKLISMAISRRLAVVWFFALLLLLSWGTLHWSSDRLQTNIFAMLPKYQDPELVDAIDSVTALINHNVVLKVSVTDQQNGRNSVDQIKALLENSDLFQEIDAEIDISKGMRAYQALSPYRNNLFTPQTLKQLTQKEYQEITERAFKKLYGFQMPSEQLFNDDPLFLFQEYFAALIQHESGIQLDGTYYYIPSSARDSFDHPSQSPLPDKQQEWHHYFIFAQLKENANGIGYQKEVDRLLQQIQDRFKQSDRFIDTLATVRYAAQAATEGENEVNTVGLGSMIGIIVLFLVVFRSIQPLILSLSSLVLSLGAAFVVTYLYFGTIYLFTLVFSSTIIGIAVDYYIHFFVDRMKRAPEGSKSSIVLPLTISFVSTILSFLGFSLAHIALLSQVALFTSVGLLVSYLNVMLLFPHCVKKERAIITSTGAERRPSFPFASSVASLLNYCRIPLRFRGGIYGLLVAMICTALFTVKSDNDIHKMQQMSPQLKVEELRIKKLINLDESSEYAVLFSNSVGDLVEIKALFNTLMEGTKIELPSLLEQKENFQLSQSLYRSEPFSNYFHTLGLSVPKIARSSAFVSIDYDALYQDPLLRKLLFKQIVPLTTSSSIGREGERYALFLPIQKTLLGDQQRKLFQLIQEKNHANKRVIVNQAKDMTHLLERYHQKINYVLIAACIGIMSFLSYLYTIRDAFKMILIPVSAIAITLFILYFIGYNITIFNSLATLLLLGMGIDYTVFLVESDKSEQHVTYAIVLACCTTLLSFGLLATSSVSVIASFGMTITLGILLILLLSFGLMNEQYK